MKGYTLVTAWHRDGRETYLVELWSQPTWRYLMFKAYHWYDSRVCHTWVYRVMERGYTWRHRRDDLSMPLCAAQDLRCYHLGERGRRRLARLDVGADTYAAIKRGGDSDGGPYGAAE